MQVLCPPLTHPTSVFPWKNGFLRAPQWSLPLWSRKRYWAKLTSARIILTCFIADITMLTFTSFKFILEEMLWGFSIWCPSYKTEGEQKSLYHIFPKELSSRSKLPHLIADNLSNIFAHQSSTFTNGHIKTKFNANWVQTEWEGLGIWG